MRREQKMFKIVQSTLLAGLLMGFGTQAMAYENVQNYFELDENIATTVTDDWDEIRDGTSGAFATTYDTTHGGILHDGLAMSIFTGGGSKDIRDISQWAWRHGSVPDKDEILHASAAAYNASGELLIYLMADRYSTDGSAEMGVWFFQDRVSINENGTFNGKHREGDLLMLATFTQGGAEANIDLYVWDTAEKFNLRKLSGVNYGYAISNERDTPSVTTDYIPKSGTAGVYPPNAFFEGGINMTQVFADLGVHVPCFSTFLIETRSSHRANAQLKDFVFGSFDTCKLEVQKVCLSSEVDTSDYTTLIHTYEYNVTNSGLGDIDSVSFTDDAGTPLDPNDDPVINDTGILSVGSSIVGRYTTRDALNPPTNTIRAIGHIGEYDMAEVQDSATCPKVMLDLNITVTKECKQTLEAKDGHVVVRVDYNGVVCNDQNGTLLKNVTVTDDVSGDSFGPFVLYPADDGNLNETRKQCETYSGVYYPSETPYACAHNSKHSNTVTATGYDALNGTEVSDTATATCFLCDSLGCHDDD